MGSRIGALALARPFVFRPFSSAEVISSGRDEFIFRVPLIEGSDLLLDRAKSNWTEERFVYVFVRDEALNGANDLVKLWVFGSQGKNPLILGCQVDPTGRHLVAKGAEMRGGAVGATFVEFKQVELPVDNVELGKDLEAFYAVSSPVLLPDRVIDDLEAGIPVGVPLLGESIGILGDPGQSPTNPVWAVPVVDPLVIVTNLTKKYHAACDRYLAYAQPFETPKHPDREKAQVRLLTKGVADSLVGIKKSQELSDLAPGEPEKFLKKFEEELQALLDAREDAARNLLRWLECELMHSVEDWFREDDGALKDEYAVYSNVVGGALARLAESDVGVTYLSAAIDGAKKNQGKAGVLRWLDEMVLPDERLSDQHIQVTFKSAKAVFDVWAALFQVIQGHVAAGTKTEVIVGTATVQVTELKDTVLIMTRRLQLWLDDDLMKFPGKTPAEIIYEVPVTLQVPVKVDRVVRTVTVTEPRLKLSAGALSALAHVKVSTDRAKAIFAIFNAHLSFCALREGLRKQGNLAAKVSSAADFASAVVGVAESGVELGALTAFRGRLSGAAATGARGLGANAIVARLGLVGAGLSIVGSTASALEKYEAGDWDAAVANLTQGVGAAISGTGFIIVMSSRESGPLAGYFALGGAAVSLAGLIWATCAEDLPLDQLQKFCALGKQAGEAAPAPGWALCESGTFADWNPKTVAGLERQLRAFQQLFYSFRASGVENEPEVLRLYPASVRSDSVFHINYTARYFTDLPKDVPESDPRRNGLQLVGHFTVDLATLSLTSVDGDPIDPTNAVTRRQVDGVDVLDIRIHPAADGPKRDEIPRFPGKESLICRVRLAVFGDGGMFGDRASLAVPTTAKGMKRLEVKAVEGRGPNLEQVPSFGKDSVV